MAVCRRVVYLLKRPFTYRAHPSVLTGVLSYLPATQQAYRGYLSHQASGVEAWEKRKEQMEHFDLGGVCATMVGNLERCRHARSSSLNKIFDNVMTTEDLNLAEKVLVSFRHGLGQPRPSLPMCVVRACVRAGKPRRALHFVRNKVNYGIFPSRRVYSVLMDALLKNKDGKGAVMAYKQLLMDELVPDGVTFFLAAWAHALMGTPEGLKKALELCKECSHVEPRLGRKAHRVVIKILIELRDTEKALELLVEMEREGTLTKQSLFNLRMHAMAAAGEYERAIGLLGEMRGEVGVPRLALPELEEGVRAAGDEKLLRMLETALEDLKVNEVHTS